MRGEPAVSAEIDATGVGEGIGARLKNGRERAGLSLVEVAEKLHVDPGAIEALEAEQFAGFGASVYVRGHLRHYAELVGESPLELQELYAVSSHAVQPPDLTRLPITRSSEPAHTGLVPGVAVIIVVALVGSGWWIAGDLGGVATSERAVTAVASGTVPSRTAAAAAATPAHSGGTPPPSPARVDHGTTPPAAAQALARDSSAVKFAQLVPASTAGTSARRSAAAHPRISELQLHFSEDSWAEVYDARGERLFFDVGSADSTRTVSGAPPLRVVLGNPVGVALALDGHPVSVPDGAARNVSIEFRINRSGHVAPSRLAAAEAGNEERKPGRD